MAISIGSVTSYRRPSSWQITPDDRQTKIEIVDGIHVEDEGIVAAGETIGCTAIFSATSWVTVKGYWTNRTLVTVADESGTSYTNRRVVVKSWTYVERFPKYITATLEFWGV